MDHPVGVAEQFTPQGRVLDLREYGHGNVNDTFLVTVEGAAEPHFILQRLNLRVFRRPELVMGNLRIVSDHVARRLALAPTSGGRRFEVPRVLLTRDGRDHFIDPGGSFWRALSFIDAAETFDTIKDTGHAREVGYALGRFHSLLSDLAPEHLSDTLPGFHLTPGYLAHYDEVLERRGARPSPEVNYGLRFVAERRAFAPVLEDARAQGRLRQRPMHGDPKVNNVMLDTATGQAVAMVDLDTVKPGLVHYDIGDCLRSGCNPLGEETGDWEMVRFEPELCRAMLARLPFPGPRFSHRDRLCLSVRRHPPARLRAGTEVFYRLSGRQRLLQGPTPGTQSGQGAGPIQADREHRIPGREPSAPSSGT